MSAEPPAAWVYDSKFRRAMPPIIHWRMASGDQYGPLISLFGPVADYSESRDKDGCKAHHISCMRWRPYGAVAWRTSPYESWRDMADCPVPADAPDGRQGGVAGKPQMSKYGR